MPYFQTLILCLATLCSSLAAAQSLSPQGGHEPIVSLHVNSGFAFLSSSGEIELGPSLGNVRQAIAYDPTSEVLFVLAQPLFQPTYLYSFDIHTHEQTFIGSTGLSGGGVGSMACHPVTGDLYYAALNTGHLYKINRQTGVATLGFLNPTPQGTAGLAFHPHTHELYVAENRATVGSNVHLMKIDFLTGAHIFVTTPDRQLNGISFNSYGTLFCVDTQSVSGGPSDLFTLDLITGTSSPVANYSQSVSLQGLDFIRIENLRLSLETATPVGGQPFQIAVTASKAEASTWLAWSLAGPGSTLVPELGVTLGLASPVQAGPPGISRIDGRLSHTVTLPTLPGVQVWVQAAQLSQASNVATFTIQ